MILEDVLTYFRLDSIKLFLKDGNFLDCLEVNSKFILPESIYFEISEKEYDQVG